MATFCVCSRCGNVQETGVLDQLPEDWRRTLAELYCPHCTSIEVRVASAEPGDVLDEEVIYPTGRAPDDILDEGYCEVCAGPCQGH